MIIKRLKRNKKIRAKIKGTKTRPRLSVFRSNKVIYAQIIDDEKGRTLVAASEKELGKAAKFPAKKTGRQSGKATKTNKAGLVGELLAQKVLKKGIKTVVFDRRGYKYHGRVKALAEGARRGRLQF